MLSARSRTLIDLATTVVIVATCGALVWANRGRIWPPPPAIPPPEAPISIDGAPVTGNPEAPVAIVMYTDYQCPYCARFERETPPVVVRDHVDTGKARLVVRHHRLEAMHTLSLSAAVALGTTNALERIDGECRRRIKTQASLQSQASVLLLLFGLLRTVK